MGLLYGNGDFSKTMDISTRAGQDADCNPSTAGGILGTMLGYSKIPEYWRKGLKDSEDIDFKYTTISLNKVYDIGLKHALQTIENNGGTVNGDNITIAVQEPKAVKFEQGFPNMYPIEKRDITWDNSKELSFDFEGTGFILTDSRRKNNEVSDHVFEAELYLDGQKIETVKLPAHFTTRRLDIFWKYPLPNKKHNVKVRLLNPDGNYFSNVECIIYSDKPLTAKNQ